MRAEAQNTAEQISKSLELLAQRLNVETAPYRLEEFNARVEDPNLWDDPDAAQKLMRDRQALVDSMATYEGIKQELADNVELIEMGEMEDDAEVVAEAEAALKALAETAAQKELEALLDGEADSNDTFLEINAATGPISLRGCMFAGPRKRAIKSNFNPRARAKKQASNQRPTRLVG